MRAAGMVVVCCLAGSVGLAGQFRAAVDVVRVPVIVTGRDNAPVKGLVLDDFELREDGQPQQLEFFAYGAPGGELPLHLGLLLDTSGSMERDLSDAMRASIQFVNTVEESVDVTLVQFDTTISLSRFTPASYPMLFERIRQRKAAGETAFYDAAAVYLEDAMSRGGQHVLVMYTDGGDSRSTTAVNQLLDLVRASGNVIVYPIGYLENQRNATRLVQQMRLSQIAEESGGRAFFPGSARGMGAIYDQIIEELSGRYTIGYRPSRPTTDRGFRKLDIKVNKPGTKVRARRGYYGVLGF